MIAENIKRFEERLKRICENCGRSREEIKLIAVSKTKTPQDILQAISLGITDLGENKAQELRDKSKEIREKVNWHFIGHLQTNKVKYVISAAEFIHSVDSLKLAEEIDKRAAKEKRRIKVLLEIKTSDEATKYGLKDEPEILDILGFCSQSDNIEPVGLMTMAPYTEDKTAIRNCFRELSELKDRINRSGFNLFELSMGMTNDYDIAVEEGATMLRIGTAIFGERN